MRSAALLVLAFASLSLAACNTMEGAGKDVQNVGRNVNSPAVEHAGQNLEDSAVKNK
jgi:predicted small secreted protein